MNVVISESRGLQGCHLAREHVLAQHLFAEMPARRIVTFWRILLVLICLFCYIGRCNGNDWDVFGQNNSILSTSSHFPLLSPLPFFLLSPSCVLIKCCELSNPTKYSKPHQMVIINIFSKSVDFFF